MSLTPEQYMALSALCYTDYPSRVPTDANHPSIQKLINDSNNGAKEINNYKDSNGNINPQFLALSSLNSWELISFQPNTLSGFAGAAFKSPSGEIVFAFRGTEIDGDLLTILQDFSQDLQIATDTTLSGPNQFDDAHAFWLNTMQEVGVGNHSGFSFTGHSLGGGLAQYMTYATNEVGHAVTFNAVGIGQGIDGVNPNDYNDSIKNYVNENDIIGQYGTHLGVVQFIADTSNGNFNSEIDNGQIALQMAIIDAMKRGDMDQAAGMAALNALGEARQTATNTVNGIVLGAHGMDTLLTTGGQMSDDVNGPNMAIAALRQVVNGFATLTGWVTGGMHYIAVEILPEAGAATVKVTLAIAETGIQAVTVIGDTVWNWAQFMTNTTEDVIYNTAITVGNVAESFADVATALYQYLFSDYIVISGTGDNDHLYATLSKSTIFNGYVGSDSIYGSGMADVVDGGVGSDSIYGNDGNDFMYGRDGNDHVQGSEGDDVVFGGTGDDVLYGDRFNDNLHEYFGSGTDILDGGSGNDTLFGGHGDDTYVFARGYGQDIIKEMDGVDTIRFAADINPEDVNVRYIRSEHYGHYDLLFHIANTDDYLRVYRYFTEADLHGPYPKYYRIEQVVFANGATWNQEDLYEMAHIVTGTSGDDHLDALVDNGDTTLKGLGGNDELDGYGGNDILAGGTGTDALHGGDGNDTYIFALGDGQDMIHEIQGIDTVQFATGINPEDVSLRRVLGGQYSNEENLQFSIIGTTDTLTIRRHLENTAGSSNDYKIEQVVFADGTVWTQSDIYNKAHEISGSSDDNYLSAYDEGEFTLNGLEGNDNLTGGVADDILAGGTGSDILQGAGGNDKYIFALGDGQDVITDTVGGNRIQFGEDILPDDIAIRQYAHSSGVGTRTEISIIGTTDRITIEKDSQIAEFVFANGTIWDATDIAGRITQNATADNQGNVLGGFNGIANVIDGGEGNDTINGAEAFADALIGGAGNDVIAGFGGNDVLTGDEGNDTYIFARGHGQDSIYLANSAQVQAAELDTVQFGEDIVPGDLVITRPMIASDASEYALEIAITGTDDKVIFSDFFNPERNQLTDIRFVFASGTIWDQQQIISAIQELSLDGTSGDDVLQGYLYGEDVMYAGDGADEIDGRGGFDYLYGEAGNDSLQGSGVLDGGTGDDVLTGVTDAYDITPNKFIFGRGYGTDVIVGGGQTGIVQFKEGIAPEDITLTRSLLAPDDITVTIDGETDMLTIKDVNHSEWPMLSFVFHNETVWDYAEIESRVPQLVITGTIDDDNLSASYSSFQQGYDGNDGLSGSDSADVLEGGSGDDNLAGNAGVDTLDGGAGSDILEGGQDSDTYIFGRGYGDDTIMENADVLSNSNKVLFAADIQESDLLLEHASPDTYDLRITIVDTGETLTVVDYFAWTTSNTFVHFEFANSAIWDRTYINSVLPNAAKEVYGDETDNTLIGGIGVDNIMGHDGNDLMVGFEANDTLQGGLDDDTYIHFSTHGNDTIIDTDGDDMLMMGTSEFDLMFERTNDDLRVIMASTGEQITIQSWYVSSDNQIEAIQSGLSFSGGPTLQNTQVDQLIQAMATFSTNNNGISWSQALQSNSQDVQTVLSQYWTVPS